MFRTIVVGCDGSEHAVDALVLAQQLRHPEGRLLLTAVHAHYGPLPDRRGGFNYARYMADQSLEDIAALARQLPADVPFERHVIGDDSVAAGIDGLAAREHADLIVLGSTHHGTVGRLTGRTTVQRLLHGAPCAIAVAAPDQQERFTGPPRICVAHDGSPESDVAVDVAYDIALGTGGSVLLLRVLEPIVYATGYTPVPADLDAERELRVYANASLADVAERAPAGVPVERRVLYGAAARSLLEIAHTGFDLLIAGSRRYGPVHRVLAGSVSSQLLTDGHVPVLVTPRAGETAEESGPAAAASVNGTR